ncbi:hypothetical protein OAV62_01060 [bacterium]|nr:hypothetical protein [bacterium]
MYVFSVNAIAPEGLEDFKQGDEVPFIVYMNFLDLFGAEQLCIMYLLQEGFEQPRIEKRKLISQQFLNDPKLINADPSLKEALTSGYSIQVFSSH